MSHPDIELASALDYSTIKTQNEAHMTLREATEALKSWQSKIGTKDLPHVKNVGLYSTDGTHFILLLWDNVGGAQRYDEIIAEVPDIRGAHRKRRQ